MTDADTIRAGADMIDAVQPDDSSPPADTRPSDDTGDFATATAVRATGDGSYTAELAEGWDIMGNVNGGYLLAVAGRALCAATERPDPITVTAHYLSPGRAGAVTVDTEIVRTGRRFTTATATVRDGDGKPVITALATLGDLGVPDLEATLLVDGEQPDLPAPEDCLAVVPAEPFPPPFMAHVQLALHPDDGRFLEGVRSGTPRLRGWFRLPDGQPVDTVALLTAVDAFPPTIFNSELPIGWVPTLELTAHLRARPEPGWLACEFRTRFIADGFLEVDGHIWDRTGRLVAQSRQLALVPRVDPELSQP